MEQRILILLMAGETVGNSILYSLIEKGMRLFLRRFCLSFADTSTFSPLVCGPQLELLLVGFGLLANGYRQTLPRITHLLTLRPMILKQNQLH